MLKHFFSLILSNSVHLINDLLKFISYADFEIQLKIWFLVFSNFKLKFKITQIQYHSYLVAIITIFIFSRKINRRHFENVFTWT